MTYQERQSAYAKKLKDPRWQKKRLEILNRDQWECRICGDGSEMLVVHHRLYVNGREPWEYHDSLLVTLCQSCHENEHSEEPAATKNLLDSIKSVGIFPSDFHRIAEGFASCPLGLPSEVRAEILKFLISSPDLIKAAESAFFQSIHDKREGAE